MVEIGRNQRDGASSVSLAPMLGGFVKTCRKRLLKREAIAKGRLTLTGDDDVQDGFADEMSDPAIRTERIESLDAQINILKGVKEKNPRYFATLEADFQEISAVEYIEKKFGEVVSPQNSRKLRERAKKTLTKGMQEIQKDVKYILPVIVQPGPEYVPSMDREYWLRPGDRPRFLTVQEVMDLASAIAAGDRSFDNLIPVTSAIDIEKGG